MEYIPGDQLKRLIDKGLEVLKSERVGGLTDEELRKKQITALIRQHQEALLNDDLSARDNLDFEVEEPLSSPLFPEDEASQVLQGIL
jgi:hypothetical protein